MMCLHFTCHGDGCGGTLLTLGPRVEVAAQNPETQTMIIAETATLLAASLRLENQAGLFFWSCVWLTNKGSTDGLNHDAAASDTHSLRWNILGLCSAFCFCSWPANSGKKKNSYS